MSSFARATCGRTAEDAGDIAFPAERVGLASSAEVLAVVLSYYPPDRCLRAEAQARRRRYFHLYSSSPFCFGAFAGTTNSARARLRNARASNARP